MLKDSFCSSPWFHLRMTHNGDFEECRWIKNPSRVNNIANTSIVEFYNSQEMKLLRSGLLSGEKVEACSTCYYEDSFGKLSGRQRQLNKSAIRLDNFALTMRSSPHYANFVHSNENQGESDYRPTDLQIDLGNTCNSACIMCFPEASSRLEQDYRKLHKINPVHFKDPEHYTNWTRDPLLMDRVVKELGEIQGLKYIHFLGGETLYDPAFYAICDRLVETGLAKDIIVGTTTNGTVYDERVEQLIKQFKEFHLGISIETVTPLNDYVRYPSHVADIKRNIERFLALRNDAKLYVSLRITPNVFTISEIDKMFEYMIEHHVIAESCNILYQPAHFRIELMPAVIREETLTRLNALIDRIQAVKTDLVNIRKNDVIDEVIANVLIDYRNFVRDYKPLPNAEELRRNLVAVLKGFETLRNNTILDYAPRYTDFLRRYGY